jgi:hypothetical protein
MANISGLSVKVSAATTQFTAGMNRVQDTAVDAALSLRRLGMASESAERDLDSAGRSATTTAGQLGGMSLAAEGAGFSIHGLSGSIILSLIPALGTLAAALAPVIFGLTGIVAIAGAIGGVGLVSVIGGIATNTDQLKVVFNELVDTITTEFGPAFDLAASVLMTLMGELMDVIPALVPADDVLTRLAGNFSHLGGVLIDALPAFVDLAVTLTEEFLPPFVTWVEDFLPQVPGMIEALIDVTRRMIPLFMAFGRELVRLLGPLNEFGETALTVIAPALGFINDAIIWTLQFINDLSAGMGQLVASGSLVLPFLTGLVSLLGGPVTLAIVGVIAAIAGFAKAFQTNFANIRTYLTGLWNEFKSVLPALKGAFDAFVEGIDVGQIADAFSNFESVLGEQLLLTLEALKPVFGDIAELLRENKEEFRLIGGLVADLISGLLRVGAAIVSVIYPAIRTVLIPAFRTFIDAVDFALTLVGDLIEASNNIQEGDFAGAQATIAESSAPSDLFNVFAGPEQERTEQELRQDIQVIIEGELPEDSIRSVTAEEIANTNRRTRRNQGRPTRAN